MPQDRIKEWGKRYLQPAAEWFGFEFPDRVVKVRDGSIVPPCGVGVFQLYL